MTGQKLLIGATALGVCLGLAAEPGSALAGPCTQGIADIGKALSQNASLGPATTGALSGSGPGSVPKTAPMPSETPSSSKGKEAGGAAATREVNSASAQVATSAQDVRLQQKGQPTVAQGGNPAAAEPMSKAKTQLEKARRLDDQNSADCKGPLDEARRLMKQG